MGLTPTGRRRPCTTHTLSGHSNATIVEDFFTRPLIKPFGAYGAASKCGFAVNAVLAVMSRHGCRICPISMAML